MASAPNDALLKAYVPAELAANVERVAALRNRSVSQVIREAVAREVPGAVDPLDEELAGKLLKHEEGAVDELLALNVVSLVHRMCLGDDTAPTLVLMLAALGGPEKREALVCALMSAVESYRTNSPCVDSMGELAAAYGRQLERRRREVAEDRLAQ